MFNKVRTSGYMRWVTTRMKIGCCTIITVCHKNSYQVGNIKKLNITAKTISNGMNDEQYYTVSLQI